MDGREPLAEFAAAAFQRGGGIAFELLPNRVFRAVRRQGRFDFARDRLSLPPEHLGAATFQRPLAELLLVLDSGFDEQLAAAVFQPADGLLALGLGGADAPGLVPDGVAAGDGGLLAAGRLREKAEQFDGDRRTRRLGDKETRRWLRRHLPVSPIS